MPMWEWKCAKFGSACGKQVNASENYLKLFRISRLCDGVGDCHEASDELSEHLRCSGKFIGLFVQVVKLHIFVTNVVL